MTQPPFSISPHPLRGEWLVMTPYVDGKAEVLWRARRREDAVVMWDYLMTAYSVGGCVGRRTAHTGCVPSHAPLIFGAFPNPPAVRLDEVTRVVEYPKVTTNIAVHAYALNAIRRAVSIGFIRGSEWEKKCTTSKADQSSPSRTSGSAQEPTPTPPSNPGAPCPSTTSEPPTRSSGQGGGSTEGCSKQPSEPSPPATLSWRWTHDGRHPDQCVSDPTNGHLYRVTPDFGILRLLAPPELRGPRGPQLSQP